MNIKDCTLLVTLFNEKSLTKVADKLFISQPAISYRLRQIEEQFDVKIVGRNNKGVIFTPEGEHIVKFAQRVLNDYSTTRDYVLNLSNEIRGVLRLAVTSNFAHYVMPKILQRFSEIYPLVQIKLETGTSINALKILNDDEVHISILRGEHSWFEGKSLIQRERLHLISSTPIDFESLPHQPRIYYRTDPLLSQLIENWWTENYEVPSNIVVEANKVEACRELARTGMGYTIIPEISLNHTHFKEMYIYPLKNASNELILRNTWLFYKNKSRGLTVVDAFIKFIENEISIGQLTKSYDLNENENL
ncbi:LysR family transcriptional regulator [Ureibacillus manganicus]|uniref:LysR family transcriptional regulator n=1 Tax=Ureibacillus manganicus TaxID=1266064 RepID=UPI000691CC8E|nr:LysR family transcriptional regulator [Ureibacillus manganicus]